MVKVSHEEQALIRWKATQGLGSFRKDKGKMTVRQTKELCLEFPLRFEFP
jgi:hypothetical protein